jgi:predicted PurR-regulated permease PerM
MDNIANLPTAVLLVLAVLLAVWLVLLLLVPFMIESIRNSSRKGHLQLEQLNRKLDRLIELLERGDAKIVRAGEARDAGPQAAERARKEPTISG